MTIRNFAPIIALALAPGLTQASDSAVAATRGQALPLTVAVQESLAAEGYAVERVERENGYLDVKASRDGQRWELRVEPATGRIIRTERED